MSSKNVNCIYATNDIDNHCVSCALNLFGGKPSKGICNEVCKKRQEKPIIEEDKIRIIQPSGQEKFDTCQNKSELSMSHIRKTCCSSYTIQGFKCIKLNIIPLNSSICADCISYQKKV